jgi:hypothetical protein
LRQNAFSNLINRRRAESNSAETQRSTWQQVLNLLLTATTHLTIAKSAALNPHFDTKEVTALAATGKASKACTPVKYAMLKMCEQFEP